MNDQRQYDARHAALLPGSEGPEDAASVERLAAARGDLDRIYAAADAILDQLEQTDNARFLAQVRQSDGQ